MVECTCSKKTEDGVVTYLKDNTCRVCGPVTRGERRVAPPAVRGSQGEPVPIRKVPTAKEKS